jgi:transposase-like protein
MATKRYTQNPALKKSPVIDALAKASADEGAARAFIEQWRWGDKPTCPHCGHDETYRMTGEAATKRGLHRCRGCKKQFTVRVGTIFEDSALPLHKWCRAIWEATKAKNGVSALELARTLQITHKSALFMLNRLRWAMAEGPDNRPKLTGDVECDETYIGGKPKPGAVGNKRGRGTRKQPVAACVQRGGNVRTRIIPRVNAENVQAHVQAAVCESARLHTDKESSYKGLGSRFAGGHHVIDHGAREYGRGHVTTNSVEGFFSRVKRSLNGTYHAVSKEHLHRYMTQFEFAHNTRKLTDGARALELLRRADGKRLTYRTVTEGDAA